MITTMIMAIIPALTGRGWMPEWGGVFNHLWQSTVFAAVAALLALGLRKNHARARYWLWLAASCKFLVPFSLLVSLGVSIGTSVGSGIESIVERLWRTAPAIVAQPAVTVMFDEISQPFTQVSAPADAPARQSLLSAILPEILLGIWMAGCAVVLISWFRRWLRVRAAVRAATPVHLELPVQLNMAADVFPHPLPDGRGSVTEDPRPDGGLEHEAGLKAGSPARLPAPHRIRIMSSPAMIEPGIFGIFRPVLLLPEGIADRLTPAQLQSILAHELCHVKRRDNLAAAMHMIVEAAFWFHPLVWWIGARLVEERERACDEEVLRSGSEPGVYAESILQVCKFYLESPLKCVAGVTGSDLKKRIESIMSGLPGRRLTPARKLMLIAASIGAIAGPVIFGVLAAPRIRAQSQASTQDHAHPAFEVASVKPNKTGDMRNMRIDFQPGGGFSAKALPVYLLISLAYNLPFQSSRISGGPEWLRSDLFDIEARADKDAIPQGTTTRAREAKTRLMLQTLLADRFKLVIRIDKNELPVYAAVVGKNGPKLQKSKIDEKDCPDGGAAADGTSCHSLVGGMGRGVHADAIDMSDLVGFVSNWTDRPVIDKTGIQGLFNIQTEGWTPMTQRPPSPDGTVSDESQALADPARPTLQMIFDRLGLKLESQKAPIDMYVIESAEKPSDNFEPPVAAAQAPAAQVSAQPARAFDGPRPSFEVASIRPSKADGDRELSSKPGKRLSASNATLKMLIMLAYQVTANELFGGPDWMASDGFDIEAKPENPNATQEQFRQMIQRMLEDRFQLKSHFETKEIPIYTLVVGKRAKLQESKGNEPDVVMRNSYGLMTGVKATMPMFAAALSKRLERQVLDETGLKGAYNFKLEFTPDQKGSEPDEHRAPPPGDHPSIFTALQEQLGLNLKAGKGPIQVLVIDRAEKPTDNSTGPVAKQENALHTVAPLVAPQAPAAPQPYVGGLAIDPKTYVIGVEDILKITVWRRPDLSKAVAVRTDGRIALALIGDVKAAGLTPARLAAMLEEAYREKIRDPEVMVDVLQVNSKRRSPAPAKPQEPKASAAAAATPKWEVISIKPCQLPPQKPGDMYPPRGNSSPGNLRTSCFPLLDDHGMGLIRGAYASNPFTPINGGPSWIHSAFYEIRAKAEGNPSVAMMRGPMMQALLEEHFHLKIHHQTTKGPVYLFKRRAWGSEAALVH